MDLEWIDDTTLSILLDSQATNGQLMMGRFSLWEGNAAPLHVHAREDEVFLLISGTARMWRGDEEIDVAEGGVVFLPREIPHAYRITSKTADMLMVCTPGGSEGFFLRAGRDLAEPRPPGFRITPERLAEAAALFGSTIIGPPPGQA